MKEKKKENIMPLNGNGMIGVHIDYNFNQWDWKPMDLFNYDTGLVVPIYVKEKENKKNKKWK